MPTPPAERPTDLRERLNAAAGDTKNKQAAAKTAIEQRDELIAQAIEVEGMSWRAVTKHTGLGAASIQASLARNAARRAARAEAAVTAPAEDVAATG